MAGTPRGAGISGKKKGPETIRALVYGGPKEDRTPDLCIANAALSQLSYRPLRMLIICVGGGFWKGEAGGLTGKGSDDGFFLVQLLLDGFVQFRVVVAQVQADVVHIALQTAGVEAFEMDDVQQHLHRGRNGAAGFVT